MSLSIGIVGLPNVGKSTLFKTLTKKQVLIANYPFATIDPNVGVVLVPDERVDKLAELSKSKKKIYSPLLAVARMLLLPFAFLIGHAIRITPVPVFFVFPLAYSLAFSL